MYNSKAPTVQCHLLLVAKCRYHTWDTLCHRWHCVMGTCNLLECRHCLGTRVGSSKIGGTAQPHSEKSQENITATVGYRAYIRAAPSSSHHPRWTKVILTKRTCILSLHWDSIPRSTTIKPEYALASLADYCSTVYSSACAGPWIPR